MIDGVGCGGFCKVATFFIAFVLVGLWISLLLQIATNGRFFSMTPTDLKTQRKSLGLSQAALADLLGCHKQAVHYWETGKRPIPAMLELAMQALRHKESKQ